MRCLRCILVLLAFAGLACANDDSVSPFGSIGDLALSPGSVRLSSGESTVVTCSATGPGGGDLDRLPPVTWLVADPSIALVEDVAAGDRSRRRIVATGVGNTAVRCRYQGFTASTTVRVVPFLVTVTPAAAALPVGGSTALTAAVATEAQAPVALGHPFRVEWTSSETAVASVTAGAVPGTATVTAAGPGTATITARVMGFADLGMLGSQTVIVTVSGPSP